MAGIPANRVVAVMADLDTGLRQISSGYLLDARRVLTARHCVNDTVTGRPATVLRVVRASDGASAAVTLGAASPALDVVVLNVASDPPWAGDSAFGAVTFGRIDRDQSGVLEDCEAIGFPLWQHSDLGGYRDLAELHGRIYAMEGRERQRLVMRDPTLTGVGWSRAAGPPDPHRPDGQSVWSGLSGAAVFQGELLIGVVIEHHPRQGPSAVQIRPIDAVVMADDPDSAGLSEVLGLGHPNAFCQAQTQAGTAGVIRHTPPPGQLLAEFTDPFMLEVHRAIDTGTPGIPPLPPYIERDHDAQLRAAVARAAAGQSVLAVLVGGSSTGKTRACWEAVRASGTPLDGWLLWNPLDAEEAVNELARVAPRTIIWLNNTQQYLFTPGRDVGERVAAGLRRLLRTPGKGPVLILGTIWHDYWATLTTPPGDGETDPYANARALLSASGIPVPDTFSAADQRALHVASDTDPRLAAAEREAEGGRVTQFLAAAPALLERYRTARPAARALIEAAMDARRLGHGPDLPIDLLEAAAPGYLSQVQWDSLNDEWLEDALTYATALCVGATGVFAKPRPRPGQAPITAPVYRLADYLEQHGRARRKAASPPADLWTALARHAERSDLPALAEEAKTRHLTGTAACIYAAAVRAGSRDASRLAAELLEKAGCIADAISFYKRAGEAGDGDAFLQAGRLLEETGDESEALSYYQRAADAGRAEALWPAAALLKKTGRFDEAIASYLQAADPPTTTSSCVLARALTLTKEHQDDEVMDLAKQAIGLSGIYARKMKRVSREFAVNAARAVVDAFGGKDGVGFINEIYDEVQKAGDRDELEAAAASFNDRFSESLAGHQLYEPLIAGYSMAGMGMRLASLLEPASSTTEGIAFYRQAAEAGVGAYAMRWSALLMAARGNRDEALAWLLERAAAGDTDGLLQAADLLGQADQFDEAVALCLQAADAGDPDALTVAAELLGKADRTDEAVALCLQAADAGDPDALTVAAELLGKADRTDEAVALYTQAAQSGEPEPVEAAAALLGKAGRLDEAVELYQRAAQIMASDETRTIEEATGLMIRAGDLMLDNLRLQEALAYYEIVGQAGNKHASLDGYRRTAEAADKIADAFAERGDQEDAHSFREAAIVLYEGIAESGYGYARREVVSRRERLGQVDQAITWLQGIASDSEPTDLRALVSAFALMREAGQEDEAVGWLQRTATAGSAEARLRAANMLTDAGHADDALTWLAGLAEAEVDGALGHASRILKETGRVDDAIPYFEQIARAGNTLAWHEGTSVLAAAGRADEALAWLQAKIVEMPKDKDRLPELMILFWAIADLHEQQGDLPAALDEYSTLMKPFAGMPAHEIPGAWSRARVLAKMGRADDAIDFYQNAADADAENALSRAATALAEAGRTDEMITWLLRRAETGDTAALEEAFAQLTPLRRTDEAIVVYERAVQAGDAAALEHAAKQLADAGLVDQALTFYLRAAEVGRIRAFEHATSLLEDNDRADEAAQLNRLGIEPGGRPAASWNFPDLQA